MKAIIMAGGEGTRLRPLTCTMPKPMAKILNRPMMEHIILLLKAHGFTDIGVTLMYMPEKIREYFGHGREWGVNLTYFCEDTPGGTAGSVKNAADFLDEDFLVISGDALTNADLTAFLAYHREKGAEASLLLKPMDIPLPYGVVVTDQEGRVTKFLEKPSWSRVLSDTVNTGIYLLKPSVLDLCNKIPCDFSKDIFPRLLSEGRGIYGYVSEDYWCDIGDLDAYRHCHYDLLSGKLPFQTDACRLEKGVYAEEGVVIEAGARVLPPVFLGRGTHIKSGAVIDGFTTIGEGCVVESGASVKRSVLYDGVTVGKNAQVRGSILLSRTSLGENTAIFEQAVLGEESRIGDSSVIKPAVKIWPGKVVGNGETVSANLVWGAALDDIFTPKGLFGTLGTAITPLSALRFGGAVGTVVGKEIMVSSDGSPQGEMLKKAAESGLMHAGCTLFDLGHAPLPVLRSAVASYKKDGGIYTAFEEGKGRIEVLAIGGLSPKTDLQNKLEAIFHREEFHQESNISFPEKIENYTLHHMKKLTQNCEKNISLSFAVSSSSPFAKALFSYVAAALGCTLYFEEASRLGEERETQAFAEKVAKGGFAFGIRTDPSLETFTIIDSRGRILKEDIYKALVARILLCEYEKPTVYASVSAPDVLEALAEKYGGKIERTEENAAFMHKVKNGGSAGEKQFLFHFDAMGAAVNLLSFLHREKKSLGEIVDEIPLFSVEKRETPARGKEKGLIIRSLLGAHPDADTRDGIKIREKNGWVLILPSGDAPTCRIIAYGAKEEYARELADIYDEKIKEIIKKED